MNDVKKAVGGEFLSDGTFRYFLGSGVTNTTDKLEIEGLDSASAAITEKTIVKITY